MTGQYAAEVADGEVALEVTTDYPWDSTVHVRVASGRGGSWELALRIPEWAERP